MRTPGPALVVVACLVAMPALAQSPSLAGGDDWSLPDWAEPAPGSGFFSEEAAPAFHVDTRVVDVTWRQLNPAQGVYSTSLTGSAQGMDFPSLDQQLSSPDPFWMRIWASGVDWAPEWVVEDCAITDSWPDYDGQDHLPIWNDCLWRHLMDLWRKVFIDWGLRSDPRLVMVYAPGAFTWCEFDFEIVDQAADDGLTFDEFDPWFQGAMADMVGILDGDNADPSDDASAKLVYTGEDYPWGPWDGAADFLARDAVTAGLGIRTGITELFNFHLTQIPAYGITIAADGHMVTDESWPLLSDGRLIATENECYDACGYHVSDLYYAIKMSNLKALQMRVNRLYVAPSDSYLATYPQLWDWVRRSLGHSAADAADAWVALREAEDRYWIDDDSYTWDGKPWVRNLERFLVQRDVGPDAVSRRGTDVHTGEVDADNGTAYEGRRTDRADGQVALAFFVDDAFAPPAPADIVLKVTYLDGGATTWRVDYPTATGLAQSEAVTNAASGRVRTATFTLTDASFDGSLPGGADFRLVTVTGDLEVRFVRLIKVSPPQPPTARHPDGGRAG